MNQPTSEDHTRPLLLVARLLLVVALFVMVTVATVGYVYAWFTYPGVGLFHPWVAVASYGAFLFLGFGRLPALLRRYRREQRREDGLCVDCGYDLTGNVTGVCSECGTEVEQP